MSERGSDPPPQTQQNSSVSAIISSKTSPLVKHSRFARYVAGLPETSLNSFCGAAAGVASGIVTCPLDVIKTKLQAQSAFRPRSAASPTSSSLPSYRGMVGTAQVIWRQDGLRGMYRGLGPMILGYLPTWAVYMSAYSASRDYLYTKTDNKWLAQTTASVTAGACSTLTTNPIWVIKTRLMSQVGATASKDSRTPWHYHSTLDAFRKMYRTEGIGAFYSGLGPAMLGLLHVAIQFPLYEMFKLQFTGASMGGNSQGDTGSHTFGILAATFLSKICASSATYPHEVLRTRMQTQLRTRNLAVQSHHHDAITGTSLNGTAPKVEQSPRYKGILRTCQTILKEEGWRAFYYGMGTNLIRAVPAAMTTMLTFESLKSAMLKVQEDGRDDE